MHSKSQINNHGKKEKKNDKKRIYHILYRLSVLSKPPRSPLRIHALVEDLGGKADDFERSKGKK